MRRRKGVRKSQCGGAFVGIMRCDDECVGRITVWSAAPTGRSNVAGSGYSIRRSCTTLRITTYGRATDPCVRRACRTWPVGTVSQRRRSSDVATALTPWIGLSDARRFIGDGIHANLAHRTAPALAKVATSRRDGCADHEPSNWHARRANSNRRHDDSGVVTTTSRLSDERSVEPTSADSEGRRRSKEGTWYLVLRALSADGFLRSRVEPSGAGVRFVQQGVHVCVAAVPSCDLRLATAVGGHRST